MEKKVKNQVKPKINFWIVSTIIFALLFITMVGILALNSIKIKNDQTYLPSPTPKISQAPTTNLKLEDFINKELLGENNNYSIYLINPKEEGTPEKIGELFIYDKKNKAITKIAGTFSIFGTAIVIDDQIGEYILLSTGTGPSRKIIPLSLERKNLAVKKFCATSNFLFYKNYLIYGNCDVFQNRPWGAGQAASLIALNLKTDQKKTIKKSDFTHQYGPTKIIGDILHYLETFVEKEKDWQNPENQKTVSKTYSLLSL